MVKKNSASEMSQELKEIFKKSLQNKRWSALDLGKNENYEHAAVVTRWDTERNKWLHRRPKVNEGEEADVRQGVPSGTIPESDVDPVRLAIRRTMKQLSGPYNSFDKYYTLEDAIELYNEIWYESSSSDEE